MFDTREQVTMKNRPSKRDHFFTCMNKIIIIQQKLAHKPRAACALATASVSLPWQGQGCREHPGLAALGRSGHQPLVQQWGHRLAAPDGRDHPDRENRAVQPAKVKAPVASTGWFSAWNLPAAPIQAGCAGVLKTTDFNPCYNSAWLSLS